MNASNGSRDWDLAIVGGGPAGCAAALRARQAGLRVILLESGAATRARPGETLHPGVEPLFAQLGVWEQVKDAGFHRHRGLWVEWDGRRAFEAYGEDARGPWQGFQAERSSLDAILLAAVREAGAEVFRPCRATGLLHDSGGAIAGLATSAGPIRARCIADASGRRAWLAQQLALNVEHHSPALRVRFGWDDSPHDELGGQPLLLAQPGGWDWHAPLGKDRSAWVKLRLSTNDATPPAGVRATAFPRQPSPAGIDLRWRCVPGCAAPGYFMLGDAAAALDPSSSHGVLRALMSGILAGHLLAAVHARSLDGPAAATLYRNWMREQFTHDTKALRELWQCHPFNAVRPAAAAWLAGEDTNRPTSKTKLNNERGAHAEGLS